MALSLALSVIAAGPHKYRAHLADHLRHGELPDAAGILGHRVLPVRTPVAASIVVGLLLIGLTWIYMLANSVQNAFNAVIDVSGLLFGSFYILTALATVVYYRRRVLTSVWDALILGILPVLAAFSSPGSSTRRCRAHPRRRTGR
jgi:amino acid transporter